MGFRWRFAIGSHNPLTEDAIGIVNSAGRNGKLDSATVALNERQAKLIILESALAKFSHAKIFLSRPAQNALHGIALEGNLYSMLG